MQGSSKGRSISAFLLRHIRKEELGPDEDIFAAGYVNSLFALQLIQFVEKTFSIRVDDVDLEMENFRSIRAIDRFVQRKRAGEP